MIWRELVDEEVLHLRREGGAQVLHLLPHVGGVGHQAVDRDQRDQGRDERQEGVERHAGGDQRGVVLAHAGREPRRDRFQRHPRLLSVSRRSAPPGGRGAGRGRSPSTESWSRASSTARTMTAPPRITSARAGCRPTMPRRRSAAHRAVAADLAVDLGAVQDRPVHDVRVVGDEAVHHGGEVREDAADADDRVRAGAAAPGRRARRPTAAPACPRTAGETGPSRPKRSVTATAPRSMLKRSPMRPPVAERELRAAAARLEHDQGAVASRRGRRRDEPQPGSPPRRGSPPPRRRTARAPHR